MAKPYPKLTKNHKWDKYNLASRLRIARVKGDLNKNEIYIIFSVSFGQDRDAYIYRLQDFALILNDKGKV